MPLSSLYWLLWQAQTNSQCTYLDVCWGLRTIGRHISASVHVVLWQCKAANCLIITWKAGTRAAVLLICIYLREGRARHCCRTVIYPPASRPVGWSSMKEGSHNRKSSILPKPRCSCAVLLSIITSFLLSDSISLCLRDISWCKKAHLSSTSLEISATAAFTKTSMIEDNWLWKGMHVAMVFFDEKWTGDI